MCFSTAIELLSGESEQFGYRQATGEYVAAGDKAVVPGKTYYMKSGETYTPVSSPASGQSLSSYYELVGVGPLINFIAVVNSVGAFEAPAGVRVLKEQGLLCTWGV